MTFLIIKMIKITVIILFCVISLSMQAINDLDGRLKYKWLPLVFMAIAVAIAVGSLR